MRNYLTFLDDLQEILNMIKTLPVCCIIYNKSAELIDINEPACNLLKIINVNLNIEKEQKLEINTLFRVIIQELLNGKTICNEKIEFKCADNNSIFVNVTMFCQFSDMYIFNLLPIATVDLVDNTKKTFDSLEYNI
jgi:hypothetical protein